MDAAERKRLIAKGEENKKIAEAIAEERRIILNRPVQKMPTDPRLAHMSKKDASQVIRTRKENMAKGLATINEEIVPEKETKPEKPKEETKAEAPKEEKPKAPAKTKRSRSKKVE